MDDHDECDVVLKRSPEIGRFVVKGVEVNGIDLPNVASADIVARPGCLTVLRVEMFVTSVRDESVED